MLRSTLLLLLLSVLFPLPAPGQNPSRGFFEIDDEEGTIQGAENALGEEDSKRATLSKGAYLTLTLEPETTLVSTGTDQPDLYIRAAGTGTYQVSVGMRPDKLTPLGEASGMASFDLDVQGRPTRALYVQIRVLEGSVELDAVHAVRLSLQTSSGTRTIDLPNQRSFDNVHLAYRVVEAERVLGPPDGVVALIEPGGILELAFQDLAHFKGDFTTAPDLDVHIRGLDGTYELWASDHHEAFVPIAEARTGSSGIDFDAAPELHRARFLRIVNTSREDTVQVDAVRANHIEAHLIQRDPNPLAPNGRWFRLVRDAQGVSDASQATGKEDGAFATLNPGGHLTLELDELMGIEADGTENSELYIKAIEGDAEFSVALSTTGSVYRDLNLDAEGALMLDFDDHSIRRARFVRILNISDAPLYIDAVLALRVAPHQWH